jgi:uncharacterized protein (DUF362 family)
MKVAIIKDDNLNYSRQPPYHPPELYPEYPFKDTCPGNTCYNEVRNLLRKLGLDGHNFGTASWNPLGEVIRPGDHVFIKPNFVGHDNPAGGLECLITHGSVVRAVLDYVHIALKGAGRITIGDSPQLETDFDQVVQAMGIDYIVRYYEQYGVRIPVVDLRKVKGHARKIGGMINEALSGDPMGYRVVDLKSDSEHMGIIDDYERFRVADYDPHEMIKHHNREKNEYCISGSILDADVIVNLPKLKTHAKTGITCALKNLIGVNGYKDWLPHHRAGSAEEGGDEYIRRDLRKGVFVWLKEGMVATDNLLYIVPMRSLSAALILSNRVKPFNDPCLVGSWHGNDTLPRTIVDLNKIIFYADRDGVMRDRPQRRMFILVDGIVAGEKEGPMKPEARRCGVLIAGLNPVEVDAVCSTVMGFDYRKIPTIQRAKNVSKYPLFDGRVLDIAICADRCATFEGLYGAYNCRICPPAGWKGHIEYEESMSFLNKQTPPLMAK